LWLACLQLELPALPETPPIRAPLAQSRWGQAPTTGRWEASLARDYLHFVATAYSVEGTTASGVRVNTGIVAADPRVLPLGSVIEIRAGTHSGIYTVLDTGSFIKGRRLDIYISDTLAAMEFGRQLVKVKILRHGWNATTADELRALASLG
jgi:3D (Asp-Asp-Asp) domain-containing protein